MIELLFAMSFVSVMLIIILTATLQVTRIYNKGITLKQVNQAGATITSELQSTLKAADAPLAIDTTAGQDALHHGRLCLGSYSYVWNTPDIPVANTLTSGGEIGMVEVSDPGSSMCPTSGSYPPVPDADAQELIRSSTGSSNIRLQLRNFTITKDANNGVNYLYHISMTISTDDPTLITLSDDHSPHCTGATDDEFCALNSFDFTVFMKHGGNGQV